MNAVDYRKPGQGTPGCDRVHVYGVAISANSCEALLISSNEISFRKQIQWHFRVSQERLLPEI